MLKQELGIVNHNRMTTQANQSVELDSNLLLSNYQSVNSSLSLKSSTSSTKSTIISSGMEKKRDIEMETASHLLTKQEKSLCLQLDLKPSQYLAQKTLLLQVSRQSFSSIYLSLSLFNLPNI